MPVPNNSPVSRRMTQGPNTGSDTWSYSVTWGGAPVPQNIVHTGDVPPTTSVADGDVWLDLSSSQFHLRQNGHWVPATAGPPGARPADSPRCSLTSTHVFSDMVRYADGVIAAYCCDCGVRAVLPYQPGGGLDAVRLKDLAAQVLVDQRDSPAMQEFQDALLDLEEELKAMGAIVREAQMVRQSLLKRWEKNESSGP